MLTLVIALLGAPVGHTAPPPVADTLDIREWAVPWARTRPRDPYVDGSGRVWFVGQVGNYLAVLNPTDGQFRRFDLPPRALPHNLVVAPDGAVWYAGNGDAHIGRLDPTTGEIRRFEMPDPAARDPHTLIFAKSGDLWFTVQGGNFIGRLDPRTGEVRLVQPSVGGARPYGIVLDESDRPWAVLFGSNRIVSVDPASMKLQEYTLPSEVRARRLARTDDGAIWYGDTRGGTLGRFDPRTGAVKEFPLPGGKDAQPYAMAVDDRGRVWVAETGSSPNRLVGFDPKTESFFGATTVPSGGGAIRHMVFHAPSRSLWFGTDTNTIGRATLP